MICKIFDIHKQCTRTFFCSEMAVAVVPYYSVQQCEDTDHMVLLFWFLLLAQHHPPTMSAILYVRYPPTYSPTTAATLLYVRGIRLADH